MDWHWIGEGLTNIGNGRKDWHLICAALHWSWDDPNRQQIDTGLAWTDTGFELN